MKIRSLFAAFLVMLGITACTGEIADEGFSLRYYGVTQIGPNLTVNLTPYYNNGEPGDFSIMSATFEGAPYVGEEFSMNAETGVITVKGLETTVPGIYKLSVSCKVQGKAYHFNDAVEVEFMNGIPSGISVEPSSATIDVDDLTAESTASLPTPTVTTDGDHVKISAYRIANVRLGSNVIDNNTYPYFTISDEGVISIVKGAPFEVGEYHVDLKINTACYGGDSEVGLFEDAFVLTTVSAPKAVAYTPNKGIIEEETEQMQTSHSSPVPVMTGSYDEVVWSIAGVTPACDKITIDASTGVISIAKNHGLVRDVTYVVDVNVRNKWSSAEGYTAAGAYSIEVVEFINPIENYSYAAKTCKFATAWTASPAPETKFARSFAFAEPEADYVKYLSLDGETGEVATLKGNQLPVGTYEVKIAASNGKHDPVVATLALTVEANPYYFTYFAYGNNLDLTEAQTRGASQFRVYSAAELVALSPAVASTDLADLTKATWKVAAKNKLGSTQISENGTITFSENGYAGTESPMGVLFVTATTVDPDDADNSFSVTVPVFVDMPTAAAGTTITFTPFVLRVNPQKGGRSVVASHEGVDNGMLILDYRRTFNYWNLEGVRTDGTAHESGALNTNSDNAQYFLQNIWKAFAKASSMSAGFGSKNPISYYNGNTPKTQAQLEASPAYLDNAAGDNQYTLRVNPGLWYDEGWADGVFLAQMTYVVDGNVANVNNGNKCFPIVLWLDKDFAE